MTRFGLVVAGAALVTMAGTGSLLFWRSRAGNRVEEPPSPAARRVPPPVERPFLTPSLRGEERERVIELLRRLPGVAAEERLAEEARGGPEPSTRSMAMDALAERRTDRAFEALAAIARTDPDLPARPLIAQPRDPNDTSTELPDEQTFTPRMQAMAALASTKDPRAVPVLTDVAASGPDESLRMEAARNLGGLRDDPRAAAALRTAASSDPSPYVRLAALHSLNGSSDPALPPVLAQIIAQDRDAGVRVLAQQVQASVPLARY